ncbi:MAG: hypothetical protein CL732_00090 [Chloroflexi bacterium]|nr:hypothetical protein [Chloroflexota bacterium]
MSQFRFIAAVAIALFSGQGLFLILGPLLVEIAGEFDVSVAVAGQLATATFAAWGVSVVISGPMSDSFGRRPVALTGLTLLSAGAFASAVAPNFESLMAARILTGLGGGMIPPNSLAAVADVVSPERRAQAVGGIMAFNTSSTVITIPLLALVADLAGWRSPFLIMGSVMAACVVLNWFWFPRSTGSGRGDFSFLSRYRELLTLPVYRAAMATNFAQRIAFFALFSYLAAYLIEDYGMSVGAVALPMALAGVGRVLGSLMGGPVAERRNRMSLIAISSFVGGVCSVLVFSVHLSLWLTIAMSMAGMATLSVGWPVLITFSTEVSGKSRATGVGLLGFCNQTGGVAGAAMGGALLATTGFAGIGYLCLGAAVFSLLVIALFMRPETAGAGLLAENQADRPGEILQKEN